MVCKQEKLSLQLLHYCYRKCCTVVTENAARLLPKVLHSCLPKMLYSQFPFTKIEYVQFGKVKTINGLYALQYKQSYDENKNKQFEITGVVFKKYFDSLKELESIISSTKITKTKAKYFTV